MPDSCILLHRQAQQRYLCADGLAFVLRGSRCCSSALWSGSTAGTWHRGPPSIPPIPQDKMQCLDTEAGISPPPLLALCMRHGPGDVVAQQLLTQDMSSPPDLHHPQGPVLQERQHCHCGQDSCSSWPHQFPPCHQVHLQALVAKAEPFLRLKS